MGAKVLIIEDNPVNARLLTVYLEEAGYTVVHAEDGDIGYRMVSKHPDTAMILLDRMMPGMDGLEVLMRFRRGVHSSRIPIIMLTAALSPAQIKEAKNIGAFACLPKPYNKEKIIETIKEALEKTSGRADDRKD
jgi:CheY-like chemotaxis protein